MKLEELEKLLGYSFQDENLLRRAITHKSWANEQRAGESESTIRESQNESLEFVGDSVLGLAVAEAVYRSHPGISEGSLTLMKHRLVSAQTLTKIAQSLDLGRFLLVGRGEEKTGGRKKSAILADSLEAVIGAVFFDGGYDAAQSLVARLFADEFAEVSPATSLDYKTLLQEILQSKQLSAPKYSLLESIGMPHERTFLVEARWETGRSTGTGRSIKSAEMMAASEALEILRKSKSETN